MARLGALVLGLVLALFFWWTISSRNNDVGVWLEGRSDAVEVPAGPVQGGLVTCTATKDFSQAEVDGGLRDEWLKLPFAERSNCD